jgi:hypothetical protein
MKQFGSLGELPGDVPDADRALNSTVNWMRGNALLVRDLGLNFASASASYSSVPPRRNIPDREVNTVAEQMLFSLNRLAAVRLAMAAPNAADVAGSAIVTWYYGLYGAASAMIAACDGSYVETHAGAANKWADRFPLRSLALPPFDLWSPSLLPAVVDPAVALARSLGAGSLQLAPTDAAEANGCRAQYFSGSAGWLRWVAEEKVKNTSAFKVLGKTNFRTLAAQHLRDAEYARQPISFLHQASRFRGKANYRDALYLSYGRHIPARLKGFPEDLAITLEGFTCMAAAYASRRLGSRLWQEIVDDFDAKRSVSLSARQLWT